MPPATDYTEFKASSFKLLLNMLVAVAVLSWMWYLELHGKDAMPVTITATVIGCCWTVYQWYLFSANRCLRLYPDRLEVINLRGRLRRTILLDDIESWSFVPMNSFRGGDYSRFTLFTRQGKFSIRTAYYDDHAALIAASTQGKTENPLPAKRFKKLSTVFTILVIGVIAFCIFMIFYGKHLIK